MLSHVDSIMSRRRVAAGRSYYDHVPTIIDGVPCVRDLADADDLTLSRDLADESSSDDLTLSGPNEDPAHTYVVDPISNDGLARTYVVPDAVLDAPDADAPTDQHLLFSTQCVTLNRDLADARTAVIAPVHRTSTFRDAPVDVSAYFKGQWEQEEEMRRSMKERKSTIRPRAIVEYPMDNFVDSPEKSKTSTLGHYHHRHRTSPETPEERAERTTVVARKTPRSTPRFLHQCPVCSLHPSTVTTVCGHQLCKMCAGKMKEFAHPSWIVCPICRMAWKSVMIDPPEGTVTEDTVPEDPVPDCTVADIDWTMAGNQVMEFEEVPKSAFKRTFSQHRSRSSLIGRMSIRVRKMLK